jgi:hypothetical protein
MAVSLGPWGHGPSPSLHESQANHQRARLGTQDGGWQQAGLLSPSGEATRVAAVQEAAAWEPDPFWGLGKGPGLCDVLREAVSSLAACAWGRGTSQKVHGQINLLHCGWMKCGGAVELLDPQAPHPGVPWRQEFRFFSCSRVRAP